MGPIEPETDGGFYREIARSTPTNAYCNLKVPFTLKEQLQLFMQNHGTRTSSAGIDSLDLVISVETYKSGECKS